MTPITGLLIAATCEMARVMSYRGFLVEKGHREPEIELLASVGHLPFDVVERSRFLRVRVGFRIEFLDDDFSVGCRPVLGEEVFHALGERLESHRHRCAALRIVEADAHGGFELGEYGPGAGRERVDLAVGEIHPRGKCAEQEVRRDQDRGEHDHAAGGI
jgi:hypothetical protein